ncbi:hypothetical protein KJB25_14760, partial [Serratia marcescens]|uniref:hypothetical protein n=1 Tax=Serratia marcescens TaxID=615 RepID=UPI001BDD067D
SARAFIVPIKPAALPMFFIMPFAPCCPERIHAGILPFIRPNDGRNSRHRAVQFQASRQDAYYSSRRKKSAVADSASGVMRCFT